MANPTLTHPTHGDQETAPAVAETAPSEAGGRLIRAKPRLLVVDDVADNRSVLARRFERRNFDVVEAEGGARALELIGAGPFDAVLLDVMMPDVGGLDVLR